MTTATRLQTTVGHRQVFESGSPEETRELGLQWGLGLDAPLVILLSGDLGAGKTVLVRGLAGGLGVPDSAHLGSPSYTLVNSYRGRWPVHHVDLYRLDSTADFTSIGLFELMEGCAVTIVEWGERLRPWVASGLEIGIQDLGDNRRRLVCCFFSEPDREIDVEPV